MSKDIHNHSKWRAFTRKASAVAAPATPKVQRKYIISFAIKITVYYTEMQIHSGIFLL